MTLPMVAEGQSTHDSSLAEMHATSHLVAQFTAGPRSSRRETEISVQVSLIFISMMTLRAACLVPAVPCSRELSHRTTT
jgi:hypothetical protein